MSLCKKCIRYTSPIRRSEYRESKGLLVTNLLHHAEVGVGLTGFATRSLHYLIENNQSGQYEANNCHQYSPIPVDYMSSRRKMKTIALPLERCLYQRWLEKASTATAVEPVKTGWTKRSKESTNILN